jgi:hypothetical protein
MRAIHCFSLFFTMAKIEKRLRCRALCCRPPCIFLVVYNGRGGSSEPSSVHSREPPSRRRKLSQGVSLRRALD